MRILGTETFVLEGDPAKQAAKVHEEAAELLLAVKGREPVERVEDEAADVIQAAFNLLDLLGVDYVAVHEAMGRCMERNKARGRYES